MAEKFPVVVTGVLKNRRSDFIDAINTKIIDVDAEEKVRQLESGEYWILDCESKEASDELSMAIHNAGGIVEGYEAEEEKSVTETVSEDLSKDELLEIVVQNLTTEKMAEEKSTKEEIQDEVSAGLIERMERVAEIAATKYVRDNSDESKGDKGDKGDRGNDGKDSKVKGDLGPTGPRGSWLLSSIFAGCCLVLFVLSITIWRPIAKIDDAVVKVAVAVALKQVKTDAIAAIETAQGTAISKIESAKPKGKVVRDSSDTSGNTDKLDDSDDENSSADDIFKEMESDFDF